MKKYRIIIGALSVMAISTAIVLSILHRHSDSSDAFKEMAIELQESKLPPELLNESLARQEKIKGAVNEVLSAASNAKTSNEIAKRAVRVGFKNLLAHSEYFDKDETQNIVFLALSKNANTKQEIVRSLTEKDYANNVFGEDQSVVRYYGIKYLGYLADAGDMEPLESTLVQLSQKLLDNGSWMNGQWVDLEDLVRDNLSRHEFIGNYGMSDFFSAKGISIEDIEGTKHKEFLEAVMHGAYDGLRKNMSHKQAEAEIAKSIPALFKG